MPCCPRPYGAASADDLVARGLASRTVLLPGEAVEVPSLEYGEQDLSGRSLDEQPGGASWRDGPGRASAGPAMRYVFPGATVHSAMGVVTVGRHVVADTLVHIWPPKFGAVQAGPGLWVIQDDYAGRRRPVAEHLLGGNSDNYYHWLLDAVGRWGTVPDGTAPVLLPAGGGRFQAQLAPLLPGLAGRAEYVAAGEAIEVDELRWTPNLTGAGLAFHPVLLRAADAILRSTNATAAGADGAGQIYVSRADASHRRLLNEPELEAACTARGFRVVRLAGVPLAEQAALFASAHRIVAPHGAGLANLMFCRPGTAVLELHMDRYVNWCFRRLAGLRGLRYGCLVGAAQGPVRPDWVHGAAWALDAAALSAALDDPRFAPG